MNLGLVPHRILGWWIFLCEKKKEMVYDVPAWIWVGWPMDQRSFKNKNEFFSRLFSIFFRKSFGTRLVIVSVHNINTFQQQK